MLLFLNLKIILALVIIQLILKSTNAFRWHIYESFKVSFAFSEKYMFASAEGPSILEQGEAYIRTDIIVDVFSDVFVNTTVDIGFAVFASDEMSHKKELKGVCESDEAVRTKNPWASNVLNTVFLASYVGPVDGQFTDPKLNLNRSLTYYKYSVPLQSSYPVQKQSWYSVYVDPCGWHDSMGAGTVEYDGMEADSITVIQGDITFRNPYGFLPGLQYGMLPFEGARMVAYVLLFAFFIFCYIKYQDSTLTLHNGFLVVFLFALGEATLWYAAYQDINLTGEPYCCPLPPMVIASLVLQVFRETLSRCLLLVVALGYGIVRPKLMTTEWIAIVVVSLLYFITAMVGQVADIISVQNVHDSSGDGNQTSMDYYNIPAVVMDVIFLCWIYLAITSTIRILSEFQQTAKLDMYKSIVGVIGVFAILFTLYSIVVLMSNRGFISLPWQLNWVQTVVFESLNFSVLAALCIVCRPTERSHLLSYVSQLPTFDPDDFADDVDEDDIEMSNYGYGNNSYSGAGSKPTSSSANQKNQSKRRKQRQEFFDGSDDFDADLDDDEFDDAGKEKEFESMMRSSLQKFDQLLSKSNIIPTSTAAASASASASASTAESYSSLPLAEDEIDYNTKTKTNTNNSSRK